MDEIADDALSPFEQLVLEALDELPTEFQSYLGNVDIMVEQRPTRRLRRELGLEAGEILYGYYEGVPLTEQSMFDQEMPATIIIFQEPLERDFSEPTELRAEVRTTVLHELAHHFGISDERLRELGAY